MSHVLPVKRLTSIDAHQVGTPRWSPNGQWIVFGSAQVAARGDIFVVAASGGPPRRVTRSPLSDTLPSWSHDGRWIYFASLRSGAQEVWKIPAEGGEARQVTEGGGREALESWDGKYLYYSKTDDRNTITRLELTGGDVVEYPQLGDAGRTRLWALTRQGIYFVDGLNKPGWIQFFDFANQGMVKVHPIGETALRPGSLAASADGALVLYGQKDRDSGDIMLVQNFN